ncbi:MAG: hypothetical protein WC793_01005 [Candidatus Paceibacterota bacterium]|jgi:hypothetical protein
MSENRNFQELLNRRFTCGKSICLELIGKKRSLESMDDTVASNLEKVRETKDFACAYKLNTLSFLRHDIECGLTALDLTVKDIKLIAPNIPIIIEGCDCPEIIFDIFGADGAVVKLYPGTEALSHFFLREGKGIFVNCHEFVGEMQDKEILLSEQDQMLFFGRIGGGSNDGQNGWTDRLSLSAYIAHKVHSLKTKATCGLAMDANPNRLAEARMIVGDDTPIFVNHMGNNFDRWKQIVVAGQNSKHGGLILEQPPPIIKNPASDPRSEIGTLHNLIASISG